MADKNRGTAHVQGFPHQKGERPVVVAEAAGGEMTATGITVGAAATVDRRPTGFLASVAGFAAVGGMWSLGLSILAATCYQYVVAPRLGTAMNAGVDWLTLSVRNQNSGLLVARMKSWAMWVGLGLMRVLMKFAPWEPRWRPLTKSCGKQVFGTMIHAYPGLEWQDVGVVDWGGVTPLQMYSAGAPVYVDGKVYCRRTMRPAYLAMGSVAVFSGEGNQLRHWLFEKHPGIQPQEGPPPIYPAGWSPKGRPTNTVRRVPTGPQSRANAQLDAQQLAAQRERIRRQQQQIDALQRADVQRQARTADAALEQARQVVDGAEARIQAAELMSASSERVAAAIESMTLVAEAQGRAQTEELRKLRDEISALRAEVGARGQVFLLTGRFWTARGAIVAEGVAMSSGVVADLLDGDAGEGDGGQGASIMRLRLASRARVAQAQKRRKGRLSLGMIGLLAALATR